MKKTTTDQPLNSSNDSLGEDLSFDDSDKIKKNKEYPKLKSEYVNHNNLKLKKDIFTTRKNKLYKNKMNFEQYDKSESIWTSIYNTFFNNFSQNTTLNELEIRCKLGLQSDETDNKTRKSKSAGPRKKNHNIQSYSDVKSYISKYHSNKRQNLFKKFFNSKKESILYNKNVLKPSEANVLNLNIFRAMRLEGTESVTPEFIKIIKNKTEDKLEKINSENRITLENKKPILSSNNQTRMNTDNQNDTASNNNLKHNLIRKNFNLLDLYEIKDTSNFLQSMIKFTNPNENKKKKNANDKKDKSQIDHENFNYILANKNAYVVELDRYSQILNRNSNSTNTSTSDFFHLLNFKDSELFFEIMGNKNLTISQKFQKDSDKVEKFLKRADFLENKIIGRLDASKKLEI